jgi:hypothetical protein
VPPRIWVAPAGVRQSTRRAPMDKKAKVPKKPKTGAAGKTTGKDTVKK